MAQEGCAMPTLQHPYFRTATQEHREAWQDEIDAAVVEAAAIAQAILDKPQGRLLPIINPQA